MTTEFTIKTSQDFNNFLTYVAGSLTNYVVKNLDFKAFTVKIEEYKEKRTNLQNKYYWGNVNSIVKVLDKNGCVIEKMGIQCRWTDDDVHEVNKMQFGVDTTTKLSTKEFCDLMESVFAFWIEKTKGEWKPLETADSYFNNKEEK